MAFGSSPGASGPPASAKQVQYLQALLAKAGYETLREARHPMGLTQRQAGGKFTKAEASALIDKLVNGETLDPDAPSAAAAEADDKVAATRAALLKGIPAQLLADELLSRGWSVRPPA